MKKLFLILILKSFLGVYGACNIPDPYATKQALIFRIELITNELNDLINECIGKYLNTEELDAYITEFNANTQTILEHIKRIKIKNLQNAVNLRK